MASMAPLLRTVERGRPVIEAHRSQVGVARVADVGQDTVARGSVVRVASRRSI